MAEALINQIAAGRLTAYSAGSAPRGAVHPLALETLRRHGRAVAGLRSKSWDVFAEADAPPLDAVVTVCGSAAAEACPVWPGAPAQAQWGLPDPAAVDGERAEAAFESAYGVLKARIERFIAALPDAPNRSDLERALRAAVP